ECLVICHHMLKNIIIKNNIIDDAKYDYLFSVEVVNDEVLKGVPFREAYKNIGLSIENGTFKPLREVKHTHEGSIGNLCNEQIKNQFNNVYRSFNFDKVNLALQKLLA